MRAPTNFADGYHQIYPDVSLNQMNRFSTGAQDMVAEMLKVAPKTRNYADYTREFLGPADQALRQGEALKGAWASAMVSLEWQMSYSCFSGGLSERRHQTRSRPDI